MIIQTMDGVNEEHRWVCEQEDGSLGEIVQRRQLTPEEIQTIRTDPSQCEHICPDGNIVCVDCGMSLFSETEERPHINYSKLRRSLSDL